MKSKVMFRRIAFVRGHKNDQNRKLTLTFSPQRQTPALHVADVPATAGKLAKSCAVMHGSWLNFRSKSPSPRKRPLLKFPSTAWKPSVVLLPCMISAQIALHSVQLPLFKTCCSIWIKMCGGFFWNTCVVERPHWHWVNCPSDELKCGFEYVMQLRL